MKRASLLLAAAIAAWTSTSASAQTYPNQPVRIVVPFAAGGAVDTVARVVGQKMSESLGQPVVVENKPGAGGNLAADTVARAAPDGYTMLLTTNGHAISPSLYRTLPFDAVKDFIPVTQLIESPLLLVASNKLPANSLQELIALAKQKPGVLNYGSTGVGNPLHLSMELLKQRDRRRHRQRAIQGRCAVKHRADLGRGRSCHRSGGDRPRECRQQAGEGARRHERVARRRRCRICRPWRSRASRASIWEAGRDFSCRPRRRTKSCSGSIRKRRRRLPRLTCASGLRSSSPNRSASSPEEFAKKFNEDVAKYARIVKEGNIPQQN